MDVRDHSYRPITDGSAIRDNPDAFYRTATVSNDVIYEREASTCTPGKDGGRQRQPGNGIFLVRHQLSGDGQMAQTLLVPMLQAPEPNPTTGQTVFSWQIPAEARVSLKVFNAAGQAVATLVSGTKKGGVYRTVWTAKDPQGQRLASGIYFVALETDDFYWSHKVVLTGK